MKVRGIYMIIVVVGVMVGCTSPRPSPGGEGGILPRPAATPSERGNNQRAAEAVEDGLGMDTMEEYNERMMRWRVLHGGMSRWESDK
jgi:hypothetical protein